MLTTFFALKAQTLYVEHENVQIGHVHRLRVTVPSRARRVPKWLQIGSQDRLAVGAVVVLLASLLLAFDGVFRHALNFR